MRARPGIEVKREGDRVFYGDAGPILERDGRLYSINLLNNSGEMEIRYQILTKSDLEYHGLADTHITAQVNLEPRVIRLPAEESE